MVFCILQWAKQLLRSEKTLMDLSGAQEDEIIEILLRVDSKQLIRRCTLVSRRWNGILSRKQFWVRKCQREGYCVPFRIFADIPLNYKMLCHLKPFNRNLVSDYWDQNGRFHRDKRWKGHGTRVESPPSFCGDLMESSESPEINGCLVTSYQWGIKRIAIDLYKEGLQPEILDNMKPPISVSEWVAHRADCAAVYHMQCRLAGEDLAEIPDKNCSFQHELLMDQWQGQKWQTVEHEFTSYPVGVRFVVVECQGKDRQYWAGDYGAKMANCSVVVKFPSRVVS